MPAITVLTLVGACNGNQQNEHDHEHHEAIEAGDSGDNNPRMAVSKEIRNPYFCEKTMNCCEVKEVL